MIKCLIIECIIKLYVVIHCCRFFQLVHYYYTRGRYYYASMDSLNIFLDQSLPELGFIIRGIFFVNFIILLSLSSGPNILFEIFILLSSTVLSLYYHLLYDICLHYYIQFLMLHTTRSSMHSSRDAHNLLL